ncbi:dof zinc finger protein DOF1.5-like [Punica granatum]|uniref:Dof-type domain-containing protein n=2 Tax=Punica granatum TaxID=22663 RepID=A0A218X649_PUNGR|nr:dof zinc finger protein DOF1.5-like [Punica granatum]OWM80199.1 hypothetical protein CDL15_Pgr019363 [Punica granatum]PKI71778.1 hypothetical protein CRG98_007794 [Punica granatum]
MESPTPGIKLFGTTITLQDKKTNNGSPEKSDQEIAAELKRPDKIIPCPRCKSMETKFCYFNNYNVNQPRHFCRGCQRYWTAGGALRNVPVGAGRRKNKPPCRPGLPGFAENISARLYEASEVQQYFDLEGVVAAAAAAETWHLMSAQGSFQQVLPAVKRQRSAMIGDHQSC